MHESRINKGKRRFGVRIPTESLLKGLSGMDKPFLLGENTLRFY